MPAQEKRRGTARSVQSEPESLRVGDSESESEMHSRRGGGGALGGCLRCEMLVVSFGNVRR
eukprot:326603-Rhodomonas_salina.2